MSDLISLSELAKRLGYPKSTIREMYVRGDFTAELEVKGRPRLARFDEDSVRAELKPKPRKPSKG